jgi:hypothetical protein
MPAPPYHPIAGGLQDWRQDSESHICYSPPALLFVPTASASRLANWSSTANAAALALLWHFNCEVLVRGVLGRNGHRRQRRG